MILKNKRIGKLSRWLSPPWMGYCYKCETTWNFVDGHTTMYEPSTGCFPLCEACWAETSPTDRLPYYKQLWELWKSQDSNLDVPWLQIEEAVLSERMCGLRVHQHSVKYGRFEKDE